MKGLAGVVLILAGIVCGVYVGFWICLVGGITEIISQFQADNIVASKLAYGIAKVFCSGIFGYLSGAIFVVPGIYMIGDA